jgi:hypothetical protein
LLYRRLWLSFYPLGHIKRMKNKRFKTSKTLWSLIAIPAFLVCWLYPGIVSKRGRAHWLGVD